eukprot:g3409.t1
MISCGLLLTVRQLLAPIREHYCICLLGLLINFVVAPLVAWLMSFIFKLDHSSGLGLFLLAFAAGAPIIPKFCTISRGDIAFSVAIMVILMTATVIILPIALPIIYKGVHVNAWDIAKSLLLYTLLPLCAALLVPQPYSTKLNPFFFYTSNIAIGLMVLGGAVVAIMNIGSADANKPHMAGSPVLALIFMILTNAGIGYLFGGKDPKYRRVMMFATAQRNGSAAMVVCAQNFEDQKSTLLMIVLAGPITLVLLMPLAHYLGRKQQAVEELASKQGLQGKEDEDASPETLHKRQLHGIPEDYKPTVAGNLQLLLLAPTEIQHQHDMERLEGEKEALQQEVAALSEQLEKQSRQIAALKSVLEELHRPDLIEDALGKAVTPPPDHTETKQLDEKEEEHLEVEAIEVSDSEKNGADTVSGNAFVYWRAPPAVATSNVDQVAVDKEPTEPT